MLEKSLPQGMRADIQSEATSKEQKNCTAADRKRNKWKSPFSNSSVVTSPGNDNWKGIFGFAEH